MTFGGSLQLATSHRALLHLQDAELQLLELIKKCLNQRVKSDREYANSLSVIINHSQKLESSSRLPTFQAWNTIVKETEGLIALLRDHAEKMSSRALDRLNHIISEKRAARKFYNEEKSRLDLEFHKLKEDVNKMRAEYEKAVNKQVQDRVKYEELLAKGIAGKRIDDARSKLTKTTLKLHKIHNDYVAIIQEANLHQQNYLDTTLPGLLDYQEEVQKGLVAQCQSVLCDYSDISNLSTPEHKQHFDAICNCVATLSPDTEYHHFVEDNKSGPLPPLVFAFDQDLLNPYKGCLQPNELSVDNLTVEYVNQSHYKVKDQITETEQKLSNKRSSLTLQKEQMAKLRAGMEGLDELQKHSYSIHKRAVLDLEREIQEIQCKLSIQQDLEQLYSRKLANIEGRDAPNALNFNDTYERDKPDPKKKELPAIPTSSDSPEKQNGGDPVVDHKRKKLPQIPSSRLSNKSTSQEVVDKPPKKNAYEKQLPPIPIAKAKPPDFDDPQETMNEPAVSKDLPPSPKVPDNSDPQENVSDSSGPSGQSDGLGRVATNLQGKVSNLLNKFKKPQQSSPAPPPKLPTKDFRDDSSYIDTEMAENRTSSTSPLMKDENSPMSNNHRVPRSPSFMDGYQQMIPNPGRKLDEEEWFHGVLPREEVQRLLMTNGDYLVRESKNKKSGEITYVLSVFWNEHKHFIIQGQDNNWRFEGEQYNTVQELIVSQHNSGVPVTRKSGAILRRPVVREGWELRNDDIVLGQKIGNGNFGDVFKGTDKRTNSEVAVKTCKETLSEDMKKKFLQEGRILKQYEHKNIVRFIGIAAQRHPVMIVMEFVPGGALLSYLKKHGAQQTKRQLVRMCEDASAGMAYLEDRNCIHRDLAARNCLVGKNNVVKISDFGMSREEEEYTVSGGLKQIPIKWTAPEALNYGTYTSACDVWSFGVLMWEVFSFGQSPYPGLTNSQARERVDDGYRMPMPEGTPQAVYDLMLKQWEQEAKNRPHFDEIHRELEKIYKSIPAR